MVFIPRKNYTNEYDRKLLKKELKRVKEFSKHSLNSKSTERKLYDIAKSYDLHMYI